MFKKILTVALVVVVSSSCVTRRACDRRFPPQVRDSVRIVERIIVRDTTIFVQLPADTVRSVDTVIVVRGLPESAPSRLRTAYATSYAQVINGRLLHELQQHDTTLARVIRDAVRSSDRVEYRDRVTVRTVNELTGWQWFQVWLGRVLGVLVLVVVLVKFSRL